MKKYIIIAGITVPSVSYAASIQDLLQNLITVFGTVIIPFLFGIAFLMFCINAFRFFILEGHSEDGREKAKNLALYSIAAAVFLIIFWGIVNLFVDASGLDGGSQPCPDYIMEYDPDKCPS